MWSSWYIPIIELFLIIVNSYLSPSFCSLISNCSDLSSIPRPSISLWLSAQSYFHKSIAFEQTCANDL